MSSKVPAMESWFVSLHSPAVSALCVLQAQAVCRCPQTRAIALVWWGRVYPADQIYSSLGNTVGTMHFSTRDLQLRSSALVRIQKRTEGHRIWACYSFLLSLSSFLSLIILFTKLVIFVKKRAENILLSFCFCTNYIYILLFNFIQVYNKACLICS